MATCYICETEITKANIARKENISVDVDEFIKDVEDKIKEGQITTQEYLKSPVEYEIPSGDELFFRSISKMAVNYYMYNGGEREYIAHLIDYIKGGKNTKRPCFWYYPDIDVFPNYIEQGKVIHGLILQGNSQEKELFVWIQLYGVYQCIVLLNDNYQGENIHASYVFDVIKGKIIDESVYYSVNFADIKKVLQEESSTLQKRIEKRLEELYTLIIKKRKYEHLPDFISQNVKETFSQHSEGQIITEQDIFNLIQKITSYLWD